jgi:hypothetical protein
MGSGKKPFQLRLDSEVYSALEAWAQDEFRSLNGQIEYLLVQALRREKRKKEEKTEDMDESRLTNKQNGQ